MPNENPQPPKVSFDPEQEFRNAMERLALNVDTMDVTELTERRRIFMAGMASTINLLTIEQRYYPAHQAVNLVDSFIKKVMLYWQQEKERYQARRN